jgi:hypothetical protein
MERLVQAVMAGYLNFAMHVPLYKTLHINNLYKNHFQIAPYLVIRCYLTPYEADILSQKSARHFDHDERSNHKKQKMNYAFLG